MIKDKRIDNGKEFDWGKTSADYAKYRDIYPKEFYQKLADNDLCVAGQKVLDIGTGTGVIPRNMQKYGAEFIGADISKQQIEEAKILSKGMNIDYIVSSAEELNFSDNVFDVITAAQCYFYFDFNKVAPKFSKMLKSNGKLALLYMGWLPFEDEIAGKSEELVLKYNSKWTGAGDKRSEINLPSVIYDYFEEELSVVYDVSLPFTRDSWNGRMKACRGVGASLSEEDIKHWEEKHLKMLNECAEETFEVKHYVAMKILSNKKS